MALRSVFFWATPGTKPSLVPLISAFPQLGWYQAQGKYSMHVCKIRENLVLLLFFFNLSLAVLGLRHCTWLSLVMVSGLYSQLRGAGFSLQWLLLFQSTGSVVVAHGFCCPWPCGIFPNLGSNPCSLH